MRGPRPVLGWNLRDLRGEMYCSTINPINLPFWGTPMHSIQYMDIYGVSMVYIWCIFMKPDMRVEVLLLPCASEQHTPAAHPDPAQRHIICPSRELNQRGVESLAFDWRSLSCFCRRKDTHPERRVMTNIWIWMDLDQLN